MASVDDDFEEKITQSTSISLKGGDIHCAWNQIGTLSELNSKIDGIRSYREYTNSENSKNNDGTFEKQDDVLFFSKIDNQYIPGVIKDKKKDKLTKDYIYKIQKIHKRDPDVDEELSGKKRSAKEDPRVEIIKLRQERAKKLATITWNTKKLQESYYKIMSANDYQIELQLALLRILGSKVSKIIKKRRKKTKLERQATKIGNDMIKSQQKRDKKKQRVAQTFSGSRQQMINMSRNSLTPKSTIKRSKSKSNRKNSKRGQHALSISSSDISASASEDETNNMTPVSKPNGNPQNWTEENVLQWLKWISQNECSYENDRKLSDEERKNFKLYRKTLFDNYFEKFINAEINGKKLFKLDNVSLRSKVYMNNAIERKIVLKCLYDIGIGNKNGRVDASKYVGTEYDFSRDWKKSNTAELKWQKKKQAAGNLSKMRVSDIGKNSSYKGTKWTDDIEKSVTGDIYSYKANKHSKHESFALRKKAMGGVRKKTVSEIGIVENYIIPEYADKAIADTMIGQATDERSRWGKNSGMDIEGDNRELIKILLHANVPIPPELTTPVKGYHTIQNRNAQLRNLLLKQQALLDDDEIAKNPELQRAMKLRETRKKFEQEQEKRELEALKKGDIKQITNTYGNKHKKIKQIKEAMKQQEKEEKRLQTGRKYRQRHKQNMSSLALIKKRKKKINSTSLALNDIGDKYKKKNKSKKGHSRKRSSSIDNTKLNIKKKRKSKQKQKRPLSANTRRANTVVGFSDTNKKKNNKKKRVSFMDDKDNKYTTTPSRESNVSDGTVILHNDSLTLSPTMMQSNYDASTEIGTPLNNISETNDNYDDDMDNDDILIGIERMHSTNADSMIIHSRINSAIAKDTQQIGSGSSTHSLSFENSDSSELTFSDDDDDDIVDDNNSDNNAIPLSIQRLRAQEKNNNQRPPLTKIMSHISDD